MDNYDNVMNAVNILNNQKGINMGARHISISTSGIVPKVYELADRNMQCTLSISLHSSNNETRSEMMPINNRYPIEELIKACKYYIQKTNRRISFEYALAKGNNDNLEDASALAKLLKGMLCHVNLIPINKIDNNRYTKSTNENISEAKFSGESSKLVTEVEHKEDSCVISEAKSLETPQSLLLKYDRAEARVIMKFRDYLNSKGIVATIRRELGADIEAACGQLRKKEMNSNKNN